MPLYQYSQLSRPTNIRLACLLPGEENIDDPRCELFEYPLRDSNKPYHPYEALSYVWGSEYKPRAITVDNSKLEVTQNLYTALLRLQDNHCCRYVWVDAICIDQSNEREKSNQIPLMAEIYMKARRVIVWLGDAEADSDDALEAIRLAGEVHMKLVDSGSHLSDEAIATSSTSVAVKNLLRRPWFRRIWVRIGRSTCSAEGN